MSVGAAEGGSGDKDTAAPFEEVTREFWAAASAGKLVVQRCSSCRRWQHPPDWYCHQCQSKSLAFEPVSGRGTIFSVALSHVAFEAAFQSRLPYWITLVELAEQPGLLMLTNLLAPPDAAPVVGEAVNVVFEQRGAQRIPQFAIDRLTDALARA